MNREHRARPQVAGLEIENCHGSAEPLQVRVRAPSSVEARGQLPPEAHGQRVLVAELAEQADCQSE